MVTKEFPVTSLTAAKRDVVWMRGKLIIVWTTDETAQAVSGKNHPVASARASILGPGPRTTSCPSAFVQTARVGAAK